MYVLFAAQTLSMTKKDDKKLRIFERKIIRRIYGHKQFGNDEQNPLINNYEIAESLGGQDILKLVKSMKIL